LAEGKHAGGELAESDEPVRLQSGVEQLHRERR
jgi:hypothetical protein